MSAIDAEIHLVRSDLGPQATASGKTYPFGSILAFHQDRQGHVTHAVVNAPLNHELTLVSAQDDAEQGLGVFDATVLHTGAHENLLLGDPDKILVQVGGVLNILSWHDGRTQLQAVSGLTGGGNPFFLPSATDGIDHYLADGKLIKRLDAQGVATPWGAMPDLGSEFVSDLFLTPTHVLVWVAGAEAASLYAVDRGNGVATLLHTSPVVADANGITRAYPPVLNGSKVAWLASDNSSGVAPSETLWQVDLAVGTTPHPTKLNAVVIGDMAEATFKRGQSPATALLITCRLGSVNGRCRGDTLKSHDLRTQQTIALNANPSQLRQTSWLTYGLMRGPALTAMLGATEEAGRPSRLWWFDGTQAHSLTELTWVP